MTTPFRPDPADQQRIADNVNRMRARGADDDVIRAYLAQEHAAPSAPSAPPPARKGSAAAGLFAAPLSVIPGATAATGVVQGLMDAGSNLFHGKPANLGGSIRHGIDAQAEDQHRADEAAPFTTAGVRGAAMALTANPSALLRAATAPAATLAADAATQAVKGATPAAERVIPTLAERAKGVAQRTAQNAATGAGYAMTNRALAPTTESVGERLDRASDAGTVLSGAAAGVALPALVGAVAGKIAGRGEPASVAPTRGERKTFTDLRRAGKSIEDVEAAYAPNMTVADAVGRPAQRRLDWAMSVPTEAEPQAAEFLQGRQGDRGTRLQHGYEEALGAPRGNVVQQADALRTTQRARATANYAAAEKEAPIDDPEVLAILAGSNKMQRLHALASDMIQEETGRRPPTLVRMVPEEGTGRSIPELVPQPITVFDAMKKAAGDVVESGYLGTKQVGRNQARILAGKVARAREIVYAQRPAYAKANAEFGEDAGHRSALDAGTEDALRVMPEEIARDLPNATPADQQLYRQGAARNVFGHVTGKDTEGTASVKFFSRPLEEMRLRALAPGPEKVAAFQQLLAQEKTMAETERGALRNSDTMRRAQTARDSETDEADPRTALTALAFALRHPARAAGAGLQKIDQAYQMRRNGDLARDVVTRYLAGRKGPDEFRAALEALKVARAQGVPISALGRRPADRALSRAAGLLSGTP